MSREIQIPLSLLDANSVNPRKSFRGIRELANTIEDRGLLQNLVVKKKGERYEVRAGDRRRLACLLLVKEKRWPEDPIIRCILVKSGDGELETAVENIQREGLPPWEDGAMFDRWIGRYSMTHDDVARAIGKSRSYVSHSVRISRGLAKGLIPVLSRMGSARPNVLQLLEMAKFVDKVSLLPDEEKQRAWLSHFMTKDRVTSRKQNRVKHFYGERIREIERMSFPDEIDRVVDAVLRFLGGEEAALLNFVEPS